MTQWSQGTSGRYGYMVTSHFPISFSSHSTVVAIAANGGSHWNDHMGVGNITLSTCQFVGGYNSDDSANTPFRAMYIGY